MICFPRKPKVIEAVREKYLTGAMKRTGQKKAGYRCLCHCIISCTGWDTVWWLVWMRCLGQEFWKPFFRNICYALENYIQRKQYQEVNLKLQKLYRIDQLTGIYNRFGMEDLGQKFYEKNCEYHVNTKFIFCDINRLKYINDTYGHKAGDWVIRKTGEALGRLTAEDSLPFQVWR